MSNRQSHVRHVPKPHPTKLKLRAFWQAVKAARDDAPASKLETTLMLEAWQAGLVAAVHELSRHGEEDVRHVIQWGLRGQDPWGKEFPDGL